MINSLKKLIKLVESWAKVDLNYLLKNGGWVMLNKVLQLVFGFIASILFANFLSKEEFGNYTYVITVFSILAITSFPGLQRAMIRAIALDYTGTILPAIRMSFIGSLVGSIGALGFAGYYYYLNQYDFVWAFICVAIVLPIIKPTSLYDAFLLGKQQYSTYAGYRSIVTIFYYVITFLIVLFMDNFYWVVIAFLMPQAIVQLLYFIIQFKRKITNENKEINTASLTFGRNLSFLDVLITASGFLDRFIIFVFLGPIELAIYTIGIILPEKLGTFFRNTLEQLLLPKYSSREKSYLLHNLHKKLIRMALVGLLIVGLYILVCPQLFYWIFPKYTESILYSQIFSISILFILLAPVSGAGLYALKAEKAIWIKSIVTSISRIILILILGYFYGIIGIIVARIIVNAITLFLQIFLLIREKPVG